MIRESNLYRTLDRLFSRLFSSFRLGSISASVDDSPGWSPIGPTGPNDLDFSTRVRLYQDALEATRKNPMAKTIIDITSDFVLGDGIEIGSPNGRLDPRKPPPTSTRLSPGPICWKAKPTMRFSS